jgi:glycosyltransferase involved in cell wall biosynthesis
MKSKFDIVYITHDSLQEGIGMSQIVPIVLGLAKDGWRVGVISCEKKSKYSVIDAEFTANKIHWKKINFGKTGTLGGASRLFRLAFNLPKAQAYHCRGDLAAVACILRLRKNFLWDVRGLWVDQKLVIGSISKNKIIINIARKLESISAKNAKAVSTLTKAVYPILKNRNPKLTDFHRVIPTCTDLKQFSFERKLPLPKKLLLSGVFNNYYDIDAIKIFIAEYRKNEPLLVTWCHGHEATRETLGVGENEIKVLKQNEMQNEIKNSSFGLALCKSGIGDSLAGVMPTKVAEFLAVGRPVVVSEGIGDLEDLLTSTRTGVILRANTSNSIKELNDLLLDPLTSLRCRKLAESHFDIKNAISEYSKIFKKLLS